MRRRPRRSYRRRGRGNLLTALVYAPLWFTAPLLAGSAWVALAPSAALKYVDIPARLLPIALQILPWAALVLALAAGAGFARGIFHWWGRRRRYAKAAKLQSYRHLSPHAFEQLTADYYRKAGYSVELVGTPGQADGGIDVIVRKGGKTTLVQCKHWRSNIGVAIVREMYGLLHHHGADAAAVISTGKISPDARDFAQGKPIELIDGDKLLGQMGAVEE